MGRWLAQGAKVVRSGDQAGAKMVLPDAIDDDACGQRLHGVPDRLQQNTPDMQLGSGVLTYYGDDVLAFDTVENKWSRVGKMPYGCITSHCGTDGEDIVCVGGEPRHGHNGNAEPVVQIASVAWTRGVRSPFALHERAK